MSKKYIIQSRTKQTNKKRKKKVLTFIKTWFILGLTDPLTTLGTRVLIETHPLDLDEYPVWLVYVCSCFSDMTGAQDGSVRMFEWNRPQQLICFRQAGNARVTRLYFNSQGNKVLKHSTSKLFNFITFLLLSTHCSIVKVKIWN